MDSIGVSPSFGGEQFFLTPDLLKNLRTNLFVCQGVGEVPPKIFDLAIVMQCTWSFKGVLPKNNPVHAWTGSAEHSVLL